jgi:hypothetical protein
MPTQRVIGDEVESEWFPAKITEVGAAVVDGSCSGIPHSWKRLVPCARYQNHEDRAGLPIITGHITDNPAYAVDGTAATVGAVVLMRFYGTPGGTAVYQFLKMTVDIPTPPDPDPKNFVAAFVPSAKVSPGSKIYIAKIFTWDESSGTEGNFVDSGITIRAREANGYDFSTGFIYPGIYVGEHGPYKMFTSLQTLGVVIDVACTEGELTQTKRTGVP